MSQTREEREEIVRSGTVPTFQSLLVEMQREASIGFRLFKSIRFARAYSISIQASESHYSSPRELLPVGDTSYTAWEVGFDRHLINGLPLDEEMGWESPEGAWSVAGWVPTSRVQELFNFLLIQYGLLPVTSE